MVRFMRLFGFVAAIILIIGTSACREWQDAHEWWLHGDGFSIGDVLDFHGTDTSLRNDTIFQSGIPVAVVVNVKNRAPFAGDVLEIRSIETGETGEYHGK
jgi:hypothetical protein